MVKCGICSQEIKRRDDAVIEFDDFQYTHPEQAAISLTRIMISKPIFVRVSGNKRVRLYHTRCKTESKEGKLLPVTDENIAAMGEQFSLTMLLIKKIVFVAVVIAAIVIGYPAFRDLGAGTTYLVGLFLGAACILLLFSLGDILNWRAYAAMKKLR